MNYIKIYKYLFFGPGNSDRFCHRLNRLRLERLLSVFYNGNIRRVSGFIRLPLHKKTPRKGRLMLFVLFTFYGG